MSGMCWVLYHALNKEWEVVRRGWVGRAKTVR